MNKQRFYYIIDNGHGGYVNGEYVNAPSKMFKHKDGTLVEEGIFNRQVAAKLGYFLGCAGIAFEYLVRESEDISLKERVNRINAINKREKLPTLLISLHGNAGKGTGYEVFTSKGQTLSDPIADVFINSLAEEFPFKKKRVDLTDGDLDKEANFTILMCRGAAILTESFFMDRLEDAKLMLSDDGQSRISRAHFNAIKTLESGVKLKIKK